MPPRAFLAVVLGSFVGSLCGPATAQTIQAGWIGVADASTDTFGFVDDSGATFALTVASGFGGTISPGTSQSILHKPDDPDVFFCGGFGFVGQARVTSPTTVTYTLLTNAIGNATQMSWDDLGNIWIADAWVGHVRRVAPNGAVTDASSGPQPWGAGLNAGVHDPATGDFLAGGNGELYRLASGATTAVTIATGLGGVVSGVDVDPCTGEIVAAVLGPANRLVTVDATGVVKDLLAPNAAIPSPNGICVDQDGNFVTGSMLGGLYVVDRLTGVPTLLTPNAVAGSVTGVYATRHDGDGQACAFGAPCPSSFGAPWLTSRGPYRVGVPALTRSNQHQPGTVGSVALGFAALPQPLNLDPMFGTSGCLQYVDAIAYVTMVADPQGEMTFALTPNAALAGVRVFAQHAAFDGVMLADLTVSNAVALGF